MTEALTWLSGNPGKWSMTIGVLLAAGLLAWGIEQFINSRRK